MATRKAVQSYCDKQGIELEVQASPKGTLCNHVHVYSPQGKKFDGLDTHNMACWDSWDEKPNWTYVMKEITDHPLIVCDDPECEVCVEDEE